MQIGISLLNNWGIKDVQALVDLATRAEALGFASVWVHDHVFNAGHVFRRIGHKPYYEPLTLLILRGRSHRAREFSAPRCSCYVPQPDPVGQNGRDLDVLSAVGLIPEWAWGRWRRSRRRLGVPMPNGGPLPMKPSPS